MSLVSTDSSLFLSLSGESESDEDERSNVVDDVWDPVFEEIKHCLYKSDSAKSKTSSEHNSEESVTYNISDYFTNVPYGLQPRDTYEHDKKNTDIMGVTYNGRMRQFIILDSKGITTWKRDAVDFRVTRSMLYPKYEYRLITYLVYAKKYNCYFALGKDFSLKVLNRDFYETCSVSSNLRSILFMLFNPVRDELITGGVGGAKVWHFHQSSSKSYQELKPLANYQLSLKYELPNVGGSWVKHVDLDYILEHLYCCSDTDLHVYDLQGKELFKFERAHTMSITGCRFSISAKVLVTSSLDSEVKVWSLTGGLVHTFRGHSRAVTNLLIHPQTSSIIITCSLDGSLRMWSLDTMDVFYNLVVSASGLLWMGLTDDNLLYISTAHNITLWNLNHFIHFWSLTRSQVNCLQLEGCPGKTKRVLAVGEDSSVRLFSRKDQKNMSTVLPPPSLTPLQKILGVCYSREFNVIFVLVNPQSIWVYTTRTDPACRMAVWDVHRIQSAYLHATSTLHQESKTIPTHRATENGYGNESIVNCCCVCILKSSAMVWTDEGCCCPIRHSYLLLGLEDGRVLFMDPVIKGQKYMEFKVSKDPVVSLHHDMDYKMLVTVCRLTHMTYLQFWSLPDLELQHEVFCAPDLAAHAHIGYMCVTGHESGHVLFHTLELATDPGLLKGRIVPEVDDIIDISHRPEHLASVITVDACISMKVFCSCSKDGAIKIWEEMGALLTEIMLDDSLSAACFLNKSADLIVAYRKHIFFIDHTKVCPHLTPTEEDNYTFDKESFVYEDLAVMYEGVTANPDPIDLDNYLVPYDIEFSKDFLEGILDLEPVKVKTEESVEESQISLAPTDLYISPPLTPNSLSAVDLIVESEVTKYDLLKQMSTTVQLLIDREYEAQVRKEGLPVSPHSGGKKKSKSDKEAKKRKQELPDMKEEMTASAGLAQTQKQKTIESHENDKEEQEIAVEKTGDWRKQWKSIKLPKFGVSPGPSPTPSPPCSPVPVAVSNEQGSSESEETDEDFVKQGLLPPKKIPDLELVAEAVLERERIRKKKEKASEVQHKIPVPEKVEIISSAKKTRRAIADVEIDVKSLMKDHSRKAPPMKKEADHIHSTVELPVATKERTVRETDKKKITGERRLPKRGVRAAPQSKNQDKEKEEVLQKMDQANASYLMPLDLLANENKIIKDDIDDHTVGKGEKYKEKAPETVVASSDSQNIEGASAPADSSISLATRTQDWMMAMEIPPLPSVPKAVDQPPPSNAFLPAKSSAKMHPIDFSVNYISGGDGLLKTPDIDRRTVRVASLPSVNEMVHDSGMPTPSIFSETDANCTTTSLSLTASKQVDGSSLIQEEGISPHSVLDGEFGSSPHQVSSYNHEEDSKAWSHARISDILQARRPATTLQAACQTNQGEECNIIRPLTAGVTSFHRELELIIELPSTAEELTSAVEAALYRYKSGTSQEQDKWYINSGKNFETNWHEKAIERHMLLRMQRALRAHTAQQRRQKAFEEQQQKWLARQNEELMSTSSKMADLAPPLLKTRPATAYASTLHPSPSDPAPTPNASRLHTARGGRKRASLHEYQKEQVNNKQLNNEQPYRFRIQETVPGSMPAHHSSLFIDPWRLDPRNPKAIRPHSSKSIPSKNNRYVLLTRPRSSAQLPIPTSLEEDLMASRFPDQCHRLMQNFGSAFRLTRQNSGIIPYSPYVHSYY
ncbi:uncharacterized protein LOC112571485 isoform X4 [Pomacea canaliculata]|uniref:uncharacterized protein LOC112571485 isoform X4 n=1 Tax=Pomacea canaliculata TaxID=400727 RepID=UPI000D72C6B2|nr:uncharacterized protein LOC112571485 isoform X4 [Pomacea canaliculata]